MDNLLKYIAAGEKDSADVTLNDILADKALEALALYKAEQIESLDELSKDTLKSYVKKAAADLHNAASDKADKQAKAAEIDRFTNRHGELGSIKTRDMLKKLGGFSSKDIQKDDDRAFKRQFGIRKAADKLAK